MKTEQINETTILVENGDRCATVAVWGIGRWRLTTDIGDKTTFYTVEAALAAAEQYVKENQS